MFPSLVTCTSIDWFSDWSKDALYSVAQEFFTDTFKDEKIQEIASNFCVQAHTSVIETSAELFQHEKRHNYVTPTSFLDFVQLVNRIMSEKMKEITKVKTSMETGLTALDVANKSVSELQEQIRALQPELDRLIKEADAKKIVIEEQEKEGNIVREKVAIEKEAAEKQAEETNAKAADAQADLDLVEPILREAEHGVQGLTSKAISKSVHTRTHQKLFVMFSRAFASS